MTSEKLREEWRNCVADHPSYWLDLIDRVEDVAVFERLQSRRFTKRYPAVLSSVEVTETAVRNTMATGSDGRRWSVRAHPRVDVGKASII